MKPLITIDNKPLFFIKVITHPSVQLPSLAFEVFKVIEWAFGEPTLEYYLHGGYNSRGEMDIYTIYHPDVMVLRSIEDCKQVSEVLCAARVECELVIREYGIVYNEKWGRDAYDYIKKDDSCY